MAEAPSGQRMAYIMGKAEGRDKLWVRLSPSESFGCDNANGSVINMKHGHVTALTVAPEYRRLKLAQTLMDILEMVSEKMYIRHVYLKN